MFGPNVSLAEALQLATILAPAADAAGRNGQAISLKNAHKVFLVYHINQGNAATILLTPQQCSAVAGTGAKAIPAVPIWACLDEAASSALVRVAADAVAYTTDAGVKNKIVVFEIDPAKLDVAGGFDCIRGITGASNVANITSAVAIVIPRQDGPNAPSLVAD
jgi:hypothetical protein